MGLALAGLSQIELYTNADSDNTCRNPTHAKWVMKEKLVQKTNATKCSKASVLFHRTTESTMMQDSLP